MEINNKKSNKLIIYSHGNASNIYTNYNELKYYSDNFGCTVVSYDYPGYGLSDGRPSEESCSAAMYKVVDHYIHKYGKDNIILIGRSLGTGVVVNYAYDNNWYSQNKCPIVLISPYKSIGRVVCDSYVPETSIANNKYKSYSKIEKLQCPVKIVHGLSDEVIDASHGRYLYGKLKNPLAPVWKQGKGHNDFNLELEDIAELL